MPAWPGLLKLTLFLCSATVASRLGFHLIAPTYLLTRSIRSTKAACSAGAIVLTNPRCTNMVALALRPRCVRSRIFG